MTNIHALRTAEKIGQLKLASEDGKMRLTDVADIEQLFRLIHNAKSHTSPEFAEGSQSTDQNLAKSVSVPQHNRQTIRAKDRRVAATAVLRQSGCSASYDSFSYNCGAVLRMKFCG